MEQRMASALLSSSRFRRNGGRILLAPHHMVSRTVSSFVSPAMLRQGLNSDSSANQSQYHYRHHHLFPSQKSFGSFSSHRYFRSSPVWAFSTPQAKQLFATKRFFSNGEIKSDSTVVVDYFELFGLPRNFGIDLSEMKGAYLKLMTEHHPDKLLHNQQQQDNEGSSIITAETITHAYQTLKSPHTRALHWLELHGSPLIEESREQQKKNQQQSDGTTNPSEMVGMEFLMEMMEWREAIEDAGSDQSKLESIAKETKVLHQQCERALEDLLLQNRNKNNNTEAIDDKTLADARRLTAQLQYWHRLERTLKDATEVG